MKIIYRNEEIYVEEGTTIGDALKWQIENGDVKDVIAARFNNSIESLKLPIHKDGEIELFNREDRDGRDIYIRGLLFILCKAFAEVYSHALLSIIKFYVWKYR